MEGAGSVEVFIDGEDRPLNARILGVSECNDLAVLDL
ncbi:MAG: peptidase S1, partial [bacterium]